MSSEDEHHHEDADGAPAPSPLRWVELVNTRSIELGTDDVSTPAALGRWLDDRGLATGGAVTARDHRRAIRLREGLRALMAANNEVPPPPGGAAEHPEPGADPLIDLGELARTLPLVLDVHGVVPRLVPMAPSSVDAALAALLAAVAQSVADGSWVRLKACREPTCRWAYFDQSRNRSRAWCSMASCGNRAKARAYRQRAR